MAETIRGINVVIGADTTKLSKALSDVNKKSKDIQSELRQVERLLKFDPKNTTLLAQKQQLLSQAIENTSEKLNRLKSVQQQVNEQFQRGEISEGQYRAFQREVEKTEGQLRSLQSRLEETNGAINKHTTAWGKLQERLSTVGNNLRDVGQRMQSAGQSMAMSMGAAATAVGGALGFAVKKSIDFEAQLDRVGAVAGATPAEIKKLEQAALDLGASTSKSATEVAQGMEIMAAMGYNTNQILAAMPGIISAAEASGEDMALVADTVSSALNAFGLSADKASKVADVLAQAANDSAAGIQDMQYTFKYAAPIAKSLGISLEELAAATEIMANNGIRGEQAGTTLRAALIRLSDPPKEAANTLEALGVKITDANGKMLPFSNIIGQLAEKTKKMSNAQKLAALSTIFGTEAASGMLTVVEAGPKKLNELTKSLENSGGASQKAAKQMKDNLKGSLEELQGAFETAQITIGNALAPAIQKVAGYIQKLVDWFNNLSPSTQKTIATIGAVSAVLAALGAAIGAVLAIIGGAVNGFGALALAFGKVSGAIAKAGGMMGLFSKAIAFLTGPIGIAVAAIAGLGVAFAVLYQKNEAFRNGVQQIWQQIKNMFQQALTAIGSAVRSGMSAVTSFFSSKLQQIRQFWQQNGAQIQKVMSVAMTAIVAIVKANMALIQAGITVAWSVIKSVTSSVWSTIKGIISGGLNIILGVIKTFTSILTGNWRGAWEGVKQITRGAIQALGAIAKGTVSIGRNIISGLISGIKSAAGHLLATARSIANSVTKTIKAAFDIHSPSRVMRDEVGVQIGAGIAEGIRKSTSKATKAARDHAKAIQKAISEKIKNLEVKFDTGKIGASKYISELKKIQNNYRLTGEQARKVQREIAQATKALQKQKEAAKKAQQKKVDEKIKNLETQYDTGKISATKYINELKKIQHQYKLTGEQSRKVKREIYAANQDLQKDIAKINDGIKKANEKYYNSVKAINDKLKKDIQSVKDEYNKQLQDLTNSIYSQTGLFDEVKTENVDASKLLKNLKDQNAQMKQFQSDLERLKQTGVSKEFIDELRAMGVGAADEIHAIANMPKDMLNEYVAAWREKHALAKQEATIQLENAKKQMEQKIKDLTAAANKELANAKAQWISQIKSFNDEVKKLGDFRNSGKVLGRDTVSGLINGLKSMTGPLANAAKSIAKTIEKTIKSTLKIKSPSRVMRDEVGKWIPLGLAEGISKHISAIQSATNQMAQAAIPTVSAANIPNIATEATGRTNANPAIIQIVTPDKRTLARWFVEEITEFQELNILRSKRFPRRFGGSLT
jgi:TP901 family phage tail tape measure protein